MGPLFWRIFAALWAGSILLMIGTAAVVALHAESNRPDFIGDQLGPIVRTIAVEALRNDSDTGLRTLLSLEHANGTQIYLLDPAGHERFGRALPPSPPNAARPTFGKPPTQPQPLRIAETVIDRAGVPYKVITYLDLPPPPPMHGLMRRLAEPLLASVLLAGLISALVARYLVSPLAKLHAATSRLGAGDLDYRIGSSLQRRRDEFTALAADFDRMAERIAKLLKSQRQLLLDLSHELRSPLARLRVALELSRDTSQPQHSLLSRMERDVERMDVLIGELLLLARIEWAGARREFVPVDIGQLVEEIVDDARLEAAHTGHGLEYRREGTQLVVRGDQELLRRAVENIVRNALQHTPPACKIQVTVNRGAEEVRISVRDDGPGIAADVAEKLFVPFTRGEDTSGNGHGLGLAISRGAVQQHGGCIETRTESDGSGFTVTICLPIAP